MSIDSRYENVIKKLTETGKIQAISRELLSLTRNDERVCRIYELLGSLQALPKLLVIRKTEKVSTYYRNHGNQCFQSNDDYRAWQYYNLSLLHAPIDSDNYSIALANRSAVFHSLKKYKECLRDIKEVFSLVYPEKLREKLLKRKASCEEHLLNENDTNDVQDHAIKALLTLSGERDPAYPCASSKLEVVFSEEMGRHVIAKEDIDVGEILVQENPYFTLVLKSQLLFSCTYCLSRSLNLLPCTNCCFSLFCSEECRKNAWKEYHSVECSLMATLITMEFTKLELLALRCVIKARTDHDNWESLFNTVNEAECNVNTKLHGHVKVNDQWVYDSQYYTSIHTLESNIEERSISDIFQKAISAAVFLHILLAETDFLTPDNDDQTYDVVKFVGGTLLLHIMTSPTNMHGLSTNVETAGGNYIDEINLASAPYAYHSLLNHSCAPNVVRCGKLGTGQMTLYALRPIKKGMQLFDNYGSHHALEDRKTRQDDLKFQYKFTCLCEACVHDWPTYVNMTRDRIPANLLKQKDKILDSDAVEELQKGNKGTALKLLKPLCEMVKTLNPYAPCGELADCQESFKQCLTILKGVLPFGYSQLVEWDAGLKLCSPKEKGRN